jgi:hypothetical protein
MMKYLYLLAIVALLGACSNDVRPDCSDIDGLSFERGTNIEGFWIDRQFLRDMPADIPFDYTGVAKICDDGKVIEMVTYKNGRKDGVSKAWFTRPPWNQDDSRIGRLVREIHFKNGERHGFTRHWYSDGRLMSEERYEEGKLVETLKSL